MKADFYTRIIKTEKKFRYVIAANIVSRFGDSIDAIAYSWMVYTLTGSKAWLAVILYKYDSHSPFSAVGRGADGIFQ